MKMARFPFQKLFFFNRLRIKIFLFKKMGEGLYPTYLWYPKL